MTQRVAECVGKQGKTRRCFLFPLLPRGTVTGLPLGLGTVWHSAGTLGSLRLLSKGSLSLIEMLSLLSSL